MNQGQGGTTIRRNNFEETELGLEWHLDTNLESKREDEKLPEIRTIIRVDKYSWSVEVKFSD